MQTRKWLAAAICMNAIAELVISAILVKRITRDELIHHRAIVHRIVVLSLTTASLTAVIGLAQAIVLLTTWQRSSAYVATGFVLPRLSCMSVYASVISKDSLQERLQAQDPLEHVKEIITAVSCSTDRTLTVQSPREVYKGTWIVSHPQSIRMVTLLIASSQYARRPSLDARRLPSFS